MKRLFVLGIMARSIAVSLIVFSLGYVYANNASYDAISESIGLPHVPKPFYLFVILDDAGESVAELPLLDAFKGKYTVSIIPRLTYSRYLSQVFRKRDIPIMLHLPMESIDNSYLEEFEIHGNLSNTHVYNRLVYNFNNFDGYIGFNNHKGSKATTDPRLINIILKFIENRNLFVLDSRTTKDTILAKTASEWGYPSYERDLFIDNFPDVLYIKTQIRKGVALAKAQGTAILIGHMTKLETLTALIEIYDEVSMQGGYFWVWMSMNIHYKH